MANASIAYINLADLGNISASSQVTTMPVSNLKDPHIAVKWRTNTNSAYFIVDVLSLQTVDTVFVAGITAGISSTVRVRVCSVDPTGEAGDISDSGILLDGSTYFSATYGSLLYRFATAEARYIRVDIEDLSAEYVEAGRVFVGASTSFTYNFNWGWSIGYTDRSTKIKSRGGQTLVLQDNKFRTISVDFGWITAEQRYGIIESVDRINGQSTDVLLVTNADSTNLPRDSVWGLVTSVSPVINPALADIFSKQFTIEERL